MAGFASDFETDTDWQEEAFNDDAGFNQIDVSASGGTDKTKFFIGTSYTDQTGILINNNFERLSGRINVDQNVNDKFLVGGGINIIRSELDRVSNDNAFATPLQLVALAPVQPAYVDGEPNPNTIYYNGLIEKENATITQCLLQKSEYGLRPIQFPPRTQLPRRVWTRSTRSAGGHLSGSRHAGWSPGGQATSRAARVVSYTTSSFLSYNTTFGDLDLSAVLGTSFQREDRNTTSVQAIGFPTDDLNTILSAAENISQSSTVDAFLLELPSCEPT